jgi:hypothetical protein
MRIAAGVIWLCIALVLVVPPVADGATRAGGVDLVSHRAVYSLALDSTRSGSTITDLRGRMAFEIIDVCDGWTFDQRIGLRITDANVPEFDSYTSSTGWESKDGTQFRFEQETKRDGVTIEELSGRAELEPGKTGIARRVKPEEMEIPLPAGTLFPTRHTALLIERALAGENHFLGVLFDGSTLDNPNKVSAFIGAPTELPALVEGDDPVTAWPVRVAFFSLRQNTPEPDIEIGIILQADGVAREIDFDYQGFTIHSELESYTPLSAVDC